MTTPLDDLVLSIQRAIDRLVRRLRRGRVPEATGQRRFLIVQIDGLSRDVFARALASGYMPFLKHLVDRQGYRLTPMSVGLPTSTPAFQMGTMYGVRPDIPGFHYYDRQRRGDIHFPRPGHAAYVEAKHAAGRVGILRGGSAYGCVFNGGSDNNLFTLANLTRPTGRGLLCALSAIVVLAWVLVKSLLRTLLELWNALWHFVADPVDGLRGWRWRTTKIALSVWVRGFFTLAACRDLYIGTAAVYVNFVDYDIAAHAFGPQSRRAARSLRHVDRSIRHLWRAARRVPEYRYDVYVLSDHGQTPCIPYRDVARGARLERWIFDELLDRGGVVPESGSRSGLVRGIRACRREAPGLFQRFLNYLDEDFLRRSELEAHQRNGVRVIVAGPNAFLYDVEAPEPLDPVTLERRFGALAEELSRSRGVGFVLARSGNGPVCFWHGKRYQLRESELGPFAGRPDGALVVQGIEDLMSMPSAGDLVIYGIDAPGGHVSYIPERGGHAGPSPDEMHTFIVHPAQVDLPLPVVHPVQLYDHFIRYQDR
jgi:hypothetical protein